MSIRLPCCLRIYFTKYLYNIISKARAAFPHRNRQNSGSTMRRMNAVALTTVIFRNEFARARNRSVLHRLHFFFLKDFTTVDIVQCISNSTNIDTWQRK